MLYPRLKTNSRERRVVVTGAGIITAHGAGWEPNLEAFQQGRKAFRSVTRFDVSRQRARVAAEAELPVRLPSSPLSSRHLERLDHSGKLLLVAAAEAWAGCGWESMEDLPFVFGTTAAGMGLGEDYYRQAVFEPHAHRKQASRVLHYQSQTQLRTLQRFLGVSGPITILSNACATGTNAIGVGWEMIRCGQAERVLTGGYEALCQTLFAGFDSLQALSVTTCRPFDKNRDGLALGEGAAVLAIESLDAARSRGAEIIGEICGYGTVIDLHHLTQPHPEGDAALKSMVLASELAGITPDQAGYINAHGTGTPLNDASEALAIRRWAGEHVKAVPVSSTKAGVGHLLGAAGAVEAVVCLMALRNQFLPSQGTVETPDPACVFPIVTEARSARIEYALSNSFGFGGVNGTLVFRRWA